VPKALLFSEEKRPYPREREIEAGEFKYEY